MPKIIESRFQVRKINDEFDDVFDIDLIDLESRFGVIVEGEHESYSDEIEEAIDSLDPGDVIIADIKSEDVVAANDVWYFRSIEQE